MSLRAHSGVGELDQLGSNTLNLSTKTAATATTAKTTLSTYLALTKPRIVGLLLVTTVPAMFLAHEGIPSLTLIAATLIGGTLAAMGANVANMILDRDIDSIMTRTSTRPLPAGAVQPRHATAFCAALLAAALAVFAIWVNWLSAALSLGAAAFYIVIYTLWLKRRSPSNIVIGGAAGAIPPLVGWAAVTNTISWAPVLLFALIFIWTPPHFWALAVRYKDDYAAASVPMLPVVATPKTVANRIAAYTVLVVAVSFALIPVANLSYIYLAAAAALGAGFLAYAALVRATLTEANSMKLFYFSMLYLLGLFAAIAADVLVFA